MSHSCSFDGCAVDETGKCALERDPSICSNRTNKVRAAFNPETANDLGAAVLANGEQIGAPVLNQTKSTTSFPSSRALGLADLNALMATNYVNVIGILGDPESGKTACLASLYLLLSHARLNGWSFAGSRSLIAFDDIARGARDWNNGTVPEQMTIHTELADDHSPGFLHLKLVRRDDGRRVEFALPDLPGEWTQALIKSADSDRFEFLRSAEIIWIVLDGRSLADTEKRHSVIARVGQLVERIYTMMNGQPPRLVLVVTHHDSKPLTDDVALRLRAELARRKVQAEIVGVAPFSEFPDDTPPGYGIAELISLSAGKLSKHPIQRQAYQTAVGARAYLKYRRLR